MSKSISISFGKAKVKSSALTLAPPGTQTTATRTALPKRPAFTADPEDDVEDDRTPAHESVLGFASDGGAILSQPVEGTEERVIENRGNADWRTRGRPVKATSQQSPPKEEETGAATTVEKEEASKKAGLQLAKQSTTPTAAAAAAITDGNAVQNGLLSIPTTQPNLNQTAQTADEAALSALLHSDPSSNSSVSNIIIKSQPQHNRSTTAATTASSSSAADETLSFLADVASRPDPATLSEYAAMPVEEFGMALLRGMGKKRRANGEVIVIKNPNKPDDKAEDEKRKKELGAEKKMRDPNAGYLGIGAKAVKIGSGSANGKVGGGVGGEDGLGAWGKADMRRNKKGEGLYTPVMLRDRRTGELISERELEERRSAAQQAAEKRKGELRSGAEEDWRQRRDRNLHRHAGRQQDLAQRGNAEHRQKINGSASSPSSRKMLEYRDEAPSRRPSSSARRRTRSRSRDRYRDSEPERDGDNEYVARDTEDKHRDRDRDRDRSRSRSRRHRQQQQEQQRYVSISSSSTRRTHKHRDRYDRQQHDDGDGDEGEAGRASRAGSERRRTER